MKLYIADIAEWRLNLNIVACRAISFICPPGVIFSSSSSFSFAGPQPISRFFDHPMPPRSFSHLHLVSLAQPTSSSTSPRSMYVHLGGSIAALVWIRVRLFSLFLFFFSHLNLAVTCLLLLPSSYRVCFCKNHLPRRETSFRSRNSAPTTRPSQHALTTILMLLRFAAVHEAFCLSAALPTIRLYVPRPGKTSATV